MAGRNASPLALIGTKVSLWLVTVKAPMSEAGTCLSTPLMAAIAAVHQSLLSCSKCPGNGLLSEIGERPSAMGWPARFQAIAFVPVVLESRPSTNSFFMRGDARISVSRSIRGFAEPYGHRELERAVIRCVRHPPAHWFCPLRSPQQ